MNKYIVIFLVAVLGVAYAQVGPIVTVNLAKYDPFPAEAGRLVTIWFDVTNRGGGATTNATLLFRDQYPFSVTNGNEKSIGVVRGGDVVRAEYKVLVDKLAPKGTAEIEVEYSPDGRTYSDRKFNITVERSKNQTDLKSLFVKLDPPAYPGSTSLLTVDITNVADGDAFFTIASASTDAADIERKDIFVGTLEANDFESVDFELKFRKDVSPGTYPVKIDMVYKNQDGEELKESDTVFVKVVSQRDAQSQATEQPVTSYIIIIVIVVLAVRFAIPFFRWFTKPFRQHKKGEVQ